MDGIGGVALLPFALELETNSLWFLCSLLA